MKDASNLRYSKFIVWKALCYNNTLKIKDRFDRVPAIASAVCPCFRTDKLPLLVLVLVRVCQLCLSFWIINSHMMDSLNRYFNFHCSNLSCGLYCFLSPTVWGFALFLLSSKTLSYFIRLFGLSLSLLCFFYSPTPAQTPRAINFFPRIALDIFQRFVVFFFIWLSEFWNLLTAFLKDSPDHLRTYCSLLSICVVSTLSVTIAFQFYFTKMWKTQETNNSFVFDETRFMTETVILRRSHSIRRRECRPCISSVGMCYCCLARSLGHFVLSFSMKTLLCSNVGDLTKDRGEALKSLTITVSWFWGTIRVCFRKLALHLDYQHI